MKVLFVEYAFEKMFNSGPAALSAVLKRAGHDVALLPADPKLSREDFLQQLAAHGPDLVASSAMTFQWEGVKRFLQFVRDVSDVPVVVGGYHPTFWPDEVIEHPAVNYLCRGEGEGAILDLAEALENGGDPAKIKNLWVRAKDGTVHKNDLRPTVANLDDLPFWDREIFRFEEFMEDVASMTMFHEKYIIPVAAGRGCPYTCTYCSNTALLKMYKGNGRFVRHRSVPHLIKELEFLVKRYPKVRFFEFWDEIFALHPRWLEEFSIAYSDSVNLPYSVFLRLEQCNDATLGHLADSNCRLILMGVEAGNKDYRKEHLNRKMANERIVKAFHKVRDFGMESVALNMIGLPHETPELIRETLELNRQIDPDILCVFIFQAFPGTPLHEYCREQGLLPAASAPVSWYEEPDCALQQKSISQEDLMQCLQEFRELQWELERKRGKRPEIQAIEPIGFTAGA